MPYQHFSAHQSQESKRSHDINAHILRESRLKFRLEIHKSLLHTLQYKELMCFHTPQGIRLSKDTALTDDIYVFLHYIIMLSNDF